MERLGTVERYFVEVKDIPRLAERIKCFIFSRTYAATHTKVPVAAGVALRWAGGCSFCCLFQIMGRGECLAAASAVACNWLVHSESWLC